MKSLYTLFTIVILAFAFVPFSVHAGFGITPPYVTNSSLTRNSVYQQTILLVRGDPTTPLTADVSVDVPGINDWFEIVGGTSINLPVGQQKVPMTVRVKVPGNADFKRYTGHILIKTHAPSSDLGKGAVNISLGAQVDVDLTVIDKVIKDFKVRRIGINALNAGHSVGWLFFPGKIRFEMSIENTGNVDIAPSDVVFRNYDSSGKVLLEETHELGSIQKIKPFETATVYAELPTRLPPGSYVSRYEIKNGSDVKQAGEVNLNIVPYGTLQTAGYGFIGLSLPDKLSIIVPILAIITIIVLLSWRAIQGRRTRPRTRSRTAQ